MYSSSGSRQHSVSGWWVKCHINIFVICFVTKWNWNIDFKFLLMMSGWFMFCMPSLWNRPILLALVIFFARFWNDVIWISKLLVVKTIPKTAGWFVNLCRFQICYIFSTFLFLIFMLKWGPGELLGIFNHYFVDWGSRIFLFIVGTTPLPNYWFTDSVRFPFMSEDWRFCIVNYHVTWDLVLLNNH